MSDSPSGPPASGPSSGTLAHGDRAATRKGTAYRPAHRSGASQLDTAELTIRVRYFAGARAAAGVDEEDLRVPAGSTVQDLLTALRARHGERLDRVLAASSFLVDSVAVRDRDTPLADGLEFDVLPPFAGG